MDTPFVETLLVLPERKVANQALRINPLAIANGFAIEIAKMSFSPRKFCLKLYKTRYTPRKRDRIKNQRHGQHPERDQKEIGTKYKFAYIWGHEGTQDRVACQYTLGFSLLEHQVPWNTSKTRYTPENEMGMNFGNKYPLSLMCLIPLDRKLLHHITLFFRINYVWCNVIVFASIMVFELIDRRYKSGWCTTGYLPSAWNTKITLHQSFGN